MKTVVDESGLVEFDVPNSWIVGREDSGTLIVAPEDQTGGWLRLDVHTLRIPQDVTGPVDSSYLRNMLGSQIPTRGGEVETLSGGTVLYRVAEQSTDEPDLMLYWWEIGTPIATREFGLAFFSFTIVGSDRARQNVLDNLSMLDQQIRKVRFRPPPLGHKF